MRHVLAITAAITTLCSTGSLAAPADDAPLSALRSDGKGRLTGGVEVGFDSFQEEYSVVDSDTVDSVNEFRSRLRLGYANGSAFRNYLHAEGRALIGDGNYETGGRLRLVRLLGSNTRSRISLDGDYMVRRFDDSSAFEYTNDLERFYLRSYVRFAASQNVSVRISDRLESIDFAERTEFDYDYLRNHVSVRGEYDWGLSSFLSTGLRFTSMSVPDSSQIEYVAFTPSVEFRTVGGANRSTFADLSLERRNYSADSTRSSFWALFASGATEVPVKDQYSLELRTEFESYQYDVNTGSYFDYVTNRTVLLANYVPSWNTKIGLGPAIGFSNSASSVEDEYNEYGMRFRLDYSRGGDFWLSGWYERGRRTYPTFDPNADFTVESIFSSYSYHRVSLFSTIRLRDGLSANAFLDYEPEDHERESDDATATLLSVSLSYLF